MCRSICVGIAQLSWLRLWGYLQYGRWYNTYMTYHFAIKQYIHRVSHCWIYNVCCACVAVVFECVMYAYVYVFIYLSMYVQPTLWMMICKCYATAACAFNFHCKCLGGWGHTHVPAAFWFHYTCSIINHDIKSINQRTILQWRSASLIICLLGAHMLFFTL